MNFPNKVKAALGVFTKYLSDDRIEAVQSFVKQLRTCLNMLMGLRMATSESLTDLRNEVAVDPQSAAIFDSLLRLAGNSAPSASGTRKLVMPTADGLREAIAFCLNTFKTAENVLVKLSVLLESLQSVDGFAKEHIGSRLLYEELDSRELSVLTAFMEEQTRA